MGNTSTVCEISGQQKFGEISGAGSCLYFANVLLMKKTVSTYVERMRYHCVVELILMGHSNREQTASALEGWNFKINSKLGRPNLREEEHAGIFEE